MQTLSFGTVMDVLQQCETNVESKTDLTMAVISIAIPESPYTIQEDLDYAHNFNSIYKCKKNLQTMFNKGKPLTRRKPNQTIIKQFEKKVVPLIMESKHRLAVLALCDMIEKDCTLDSENGESTSRFETYIEKPIQEFLNDTKYVFSEFLARICLYTIFEVKNRACEDWVKKLSNEYDTYEKGFKNYVDSFENNKREILIWGTSIEKEQSQNTACQTIGNRTALTPPEEDTNEICLCCETQTTDSKAALTPSKEDTIGGETYEDYRKRTNSFAVRDIGPENQICLCCENWTGDMENALKAPHGSLGMCTLKNEKKLSTNSMCNWKIPSLKRANKRWASMFDSQ